MTKTCGKHRHVGNLVQNMSVSDKVANLIAKKMQRGGEMDFKGLVKQVAPTVAPVAGKAINGVLPCCRKRCQVVAEKEDKELRGDKVLGWPWLLLPFYLVY